MSSLYTFFKFEQKTRFFQFFVFFWILPYGITTNTHSGPFPMHFEYLGVHIALSRNVFAWFKANCELYGEITESQNFQKKFYGHHGEFVNET